MYPTKKLREVCEIKKWKKVNYSEQWKYNYIDIGILRTNIIEQYTNDEWIFCNKNDILIAWDGSKSGTVGFWLEWVIGSTLAKITIDTEMFLTEFIGKFLQGNFDYLNKNTSGAAIPHLRKDILINLEIPLPPLETQKLIVEKLDVIFAEIEKSKNLLEKNLQNVDEMNKGLLFSLYKFPKISIWDVAEKIFAGWDLPKNWNFSKEKTEKYNIPIIANAIKDDGLYGYTDEAKVTEKAITISARWTIWFTKLRENPFYPIVRLLVLIPDEKKVLWKYLEYIFKTINFKQFGSSIPQLSVPQLKNFQIPLPPLSEQKEIVAYLDNIFLENQKLKNLYQAQIKNLDEMKQSFLKKAFAGELV